MEDPAALVFLQCVLLETMTIFSVLEIVCVVVTFWRWGEGGDSTSNDVITFSRWILGHNIGGNAFFYEILLSTQIRTVIISKTQQNFVIELDLN